MRGDLVNSQAVKNFFSKNGNYLLPAAYPEGCPQHPSYPEAHGSVAGAGVTVLKAFFDESTKLKAFFESLPIPKPTLKVASVDGNSLLDYPGAGPPDAVSITWGGG